MKHLLFLILVGLVNQAVAATNLLELRVSSLRPTMRGYLKSVVLTSEGKAVYSVNNVENSVENKQIEVAKLTEQELKKVKSAIAEASQGDSKRQTDLCEAIPQLHKIYKAETLVLRDAKVPCGGATYNDNASAKELVKQLEQWIAIGDSKGN